MFGKFLEDNSGRVPNNIFGGIPKKKSVAVSKTTVGGIPKDFVEGTVGEIIPKKYWGKSSKKLGN